MVTSSRGAIMPLIEAFRLIVVGTPGAAPGFGRNADGGRQARLLATVVRFADGAFAALTEFVLSILIFLTAAAVMISLSRAPELRCVMAPLACSCAMPRTAAIGLAPFCAPLAGSGLSAVL
jgi:hypothetical protein